MDELQQSVLRECAAFADRLACVKAIYVFGSVGRGDYRPESDVDIFVEYLNSDDILVLESLCSMRAESVAFSLHLGSLVKREISLHGIDHLQPRDLAWPAIELAKPDAVAILGKAFLVATPSKRICNNG